MLLLLVCSAYSSSRRKRAPLRASPAPDTLTVAVSHRAADAAAAAAVAAATAELCNGNYNKAIRARLRVMSERRILHGTKRARAYRRSGSPAACRRPAGTLGRRSSASYSSYTPRVSVLRSCRAVSIQQAAGGTCYAKKMLGDMESKNVPYFSPKPTFAKVFFYLFFRKTPPILPLVFIFGKGSKKKKNAFAKHSDDCNVLRSKHLFKSSALHACQELALTNLLPPPPPSFSSPI